MAQVPNLGVKIKLENIEPRDTIFGQENAGTREYVIAYHPIPKGIVKEEPTSEEDGDECQLIAYSSFSPGVIKEESELGNDSDDISSTEVQDVQKDQGSKMSEHSSFEDFDESAYSLAADSTDNFSPEAGPSNEKPKRKIPKATVLLSSSKGSINSQLHKKKDDSQPTTADGHRFKCNKCERVYKHKWSLTHHLKYECGIEPGFLCSQCDRRFNRKYCLRKHLINVHKIDPRQLGNYGAGLKQEQVMAFKCTKCESSYKQKRSLDQHTRKECGIVFSCTLCKLNLKTKSSLRSHLVGVHNITRGQLDKYGAGYKVRPIYPFKCNQCGRTYKQKEYLAHHLQLECGVEPSFPCSKCDRRFKQKSHLKSHLIEIHNVELSQLATFGLGPVVRPENQFKCDQCGNSYKQKKNLKNHLIFECGKDPSFACTLCGYRASRNGNLKQHVKNVHSVDE